MGANSWCVHTAYNFFISKQPAWLLFYFTNMITYLVSQCDIDTISNLIRERFNQNLPFVKQKEQISGIFDSLNSLGAKSALLELNYIDKDYIDDFSKYYLRCFGNEGHECARLHFFSREISHGLITEVLSEGVHHVEYKNIVESYCGFMVIKPLPKTFIGKTCIAVPKLENEPVLLSKTYKVDLFGMALEVNSIPFQEQDKVVSACATTAIWTVLHSLPFTTPRDVPSCSTITANALASAESSSNKFPNHELSNEQILRAFDAQKLKHHTFSFKNASVNKIDLAFRVIASHINSQLPVFVGADVFSLNSSGADYLGGHAVCVVGYAVEKHFKGDLVKLYVHDDRLGPFVEMLLCNYQDGVEGGLFLKRAQQKHGGDLREVLRVTDIVAVTPEKARIPFEMLVATCQHIVDKYIALQIEDAASKATNKLVSEESQAPKQILQLDYSLTLQEIGVLRSHVMTVDLEREENRALEKKLKKKRVEFLAKNYPKYVWVAKFMTKSGYVLPWVIFNATDIPHGDVVCGLFDESYNVDEEFESFLKMVLELYQTQESKSFESHFISALFCYIDRERAKTTSSLAYLDRTYGALRAPKYIKPKEVQVLSESVVEKFYDVNPDGKTLESVFNSIQENSSESFILWIVSKSGELLLGPEKKEIGHPFIAQLQTARISGELRRVKENCFEINSKSGRYSGDYGVDAKCYLENAKRKFLALFPGVEINVDAS